MLFFVCFLAQRCILKTKQKKLKAASKQLESDRTSVEEEGKEKQNENEEKQDDDEKINDRDNSSDDGDNKEDCGGDKSEDDSSEKDVIKLLLEYGADVNETEDLMKTPLMIAASKENLELLHILFNCPNVDLEVG